MKADDAYTRLVAYQHNLDSQVRGAVQDINRLVSEIDFLNKEITKAEISGDNANDFRDQRNLALDKLCKIIPIECKEKKDGRVDLITEGKELLSNGAQSKLGLRYVSSANSYIEPVFTDSDSILPPDAPLDEYEPLFSFTQPVDAKHYNDSGSLKGMLVSRGTSSANYLGEAAYGPEPAVSSPPSDPNAPDYGDLLAKYKKELAVNKNWHNDIFSVNYCFIPKVMVQLDTIVNKIVTMVNDAFAPADANGVQDTAKGPYDLYGNQSFTEVFMRKTMERWNSTTLIPVEDTNYYSQYTMGNLMVNPLVMKDGGFNLIALSPSGDREDNTLVNSLIREWDSEIVSLGTDSYSINDAYKQFITSVGTETDEDLSFLDSQEMLVEQTDQKRGFIKDVSLDEELRNMMMFQHAYESSARILNTIDSMLQTVVNGTGRVGR
jgi:flagellar hook-associated protein 1 FlgK